MKVALLTRGTTELSWSIIEKLRQLSNVDLLVLSTGRIPVKNKYPDWRRELLRYRIGLRRAFLKENHPNLATPPLDLEYHYNPDINHNSNLEVLTRFSPDLLIINGTKLVESTLLETAGLSVNLHHGFLPLYRGVSSIDWVIKEQNYSYFCVTLHMAVKALDAGSVIASKYVTPYFHESLSIFRRRLLLAGTEVLLNTLLSYPEIEYVAQPLSIYSRNFRHRDKGGDHVSAVEEEYKSRNLNRYTFLQHYRPYLQRMGTPGPRKGMIPTGKRLIMGRVINDLTRKQISPGLYVLTYHDLCHDNVSQHFHAANTLLIFSSQNIFCRTLPFLKITLCVYP